MEAIRRAVDGLRARHWPPTDAVALAAMAGLALAPPAIYGLLEQTASPAFAGIASMSACTPCGLALLRVHAAWRRDRRLRAYWGL